MAALGELLAAIELAALSDVLAAVGAEVAAAGSSSTTAARPGLALGDVLAAAEVAALSDVLAAAEVLAAVEVPARPSAALDAAAYCWRATR